jgi:hypothetical protein
VLGRLIDIEPAQADLLKQVCAGPTISGAELKDAGAFDTPRAKRKKSTNQQGPSLFDNEH